MYTDRNKDNLNYFQQREKLFQAVGSHDAYDLISFFSDHPNFNPNVIHPQYRTTPYQAAQAHGKVEHMMVLRGAEFNHNTPKQQWNAHTQNRHVSLNQGFSSRKDLDDLGIMLGQKSSEKILAFNEESPEQNGIGATHSWEKQFTYRSSTRHRNTHNTHSR